MELDTNPTKPTKCVTYREVQLIRSPAYRELTIYIYIYIYLLFLFGGVLSSHPGT